MSNELCKLEIKDPFFLQTSYDTLYGKNCLYTQAKGVEKSREKKTELPRS